MPINQSLVIGINWSISRKNYNLKICPCDVSYFVFRHFKFKTIFFLELEKKIYSYFQGRKTSRAHTHTHLTIHTVWRIMLHRWTAKQISQQNNKFTHTHTHTHTSTQNAIKQKCIEEKKIINKTNSVSFISFYFDFKLNRIELNSYLWHWTADIQSSPKICVYLGLPYAQYTTCYDIT